MIGDVRAGSFFAMFRDRSGVAAIEFAALILPLSMLIFAIVEISIMYLAASSLDASVQKISRTIRTGDTKSSNTSLASLKAEICADMLFSFGCSDNLRMNVAVISDLSSMSSLSAIDSSGKLTLTEAFATGSGGDYIFVQAFLPWDSAVNFFTFSNNRLADGRYLVGSTALFRNEPF